MNNKLISTKQLVLVGLLTALSIVLDLTGLGFIPTPTLQLTFMHVPVIIGAIIEGPLIGAVCGFMFGLFSLIKAFTTPHPMSVFFFDPLVSIGARILMGYLTGLAFVKLKKLPLYLKSAISAFIGSITNTVGVLGLIWLLHAKKFAQMNNLEMGKLKTVILGIAFGNGFPEAILAVIITVPVIYALKNRFPSVKERK